MTSNNFEKRLAWIEQNVKELESQREEWDLEVELAEYRLKKKHPEEFPIIGGVRE